jgi:hypothetical protein
MFCGRDIVRRSMTECPRSDGATCRRTARARSSNENWTAGASERSDTISRSAIRTRAPDSEARPACCRSSTATKMSPERKTTSAVSLWSPLTKMSNWASLIAGSHLLRVRARARLWRRRRQRQREEDPLCPLHGGQAPAAQRHRRGSPDRMPPRRGRCAPSRDVAGSVEPAEHLRAGGEHVPAVPPLVRARGLPGTVSPVGGHFARPDADVAHVAEAEDEVACLDLSFHPRRGNAVARLEEDGDSEPRQHLDRGTVAGFLGWRQLFDEDAVGLLQRSELVGRGADAQVALLARLQGQELGKEDEIARGRELHLAALVLRPADGVRLEPGRGGAVVAQGDDCVLVRAGELDEDRSYLKPRRRGRPRPEHRPEKGAGDLDRGPHGSWFYSLRSSASRPRCRRSYRERRTGLPGCGRKR